VSSATRHPICLRAISCCTTCCPGVPAARCAATTRAKRSLWRCCGCRCPPSTTSRKCFGLRHVLPKVHELQTVGFGRRNLDPGGRGHEESVHSGPPPPAAVLTLNRPARRNALSRGLVAALTAAFIRARGDAAARSVIITGAGTAFCAGMDLAEL